jgi:murein DD-endopeptidase MepM/ murein hydrolase activator NlpD
MSVPFDPRYLPAVTQTFSPGIGEYGADFAMPVGTVIKAPGGGTIFAEEDKGTNAWGYRIFEKLDNGWTFAVGHVSKFLVPTGTRVSAGQDIALSGGAVGDPHGGHTTGPHIEPQLIDPSGQYHDPLAWLNRLFSSGGTLPAMPSGSGVGGPAPTNQGGTGMTFSDFLSGFNPLGALPNPKLQAQGLTQAGVDATVAATAPFAWATGWAGQQGHNLSGFFTANVIAILVGVAIVLILFEGDLSSGSAAPRPVRPVPVPV